MEEVILDDPWILCTLTSRDIVGFKILFKNKTQIILDDPWAHLLQRPFLF